MKSIGLMALFVLLGVRRELEAGSIQDQALNATVGRRDSAQLCWGIPDPPTSPGPAAVLTLRAFGETLVGSAPFMGTDLTGHWINGLPAAAALSSSWKSVGRATGPEWEYVATELRITNSVSSGVLKRHLIKVEPDLFVVCDEVSLEPAATWEETLGFPATAVWDSRREEWRMQGSQSGLTIRLLMPSGARQQQQVSGPESVSKVIAADLRFGTTHLQSSFEQLIVFVPHRGESARGLAFKRLDSDSAIGVRVHRDGLPTLVAFRRRSTSGQADLTGLKFDGPVAVDVFRPKTRR